MAKNVVKAARIAEAKAAEPSAEVPARGRFSSYVIVTRVSEGVRRGAPAVQSAFAWVRDQLSFWTFLGVVAFGTLFYLFFIAQPLYMSEALVSIKTQSAGFSGLGSMLGGGVLGGSGPSGPDAALLSYIQSPDIVAKLNQQLHLRDSYTSSDQNWFNRMDKDADWETMLKRYLSMIDVEMGDQASDLIDLKVYDRDPKRAQAINEAIVAQSITFVNKLSDAIRAATLRTAKMEFEEAMKADAAAQPFERAIADQRLQAAQSALAQVSSLASQQQVFLVRVSGPTLPTEVARPVIIIDFITMMVVAVGLYMVGFLVFQNIKDHRRV